MKQHVIGIDIGTGSMKAVAVRTDGKIIATSQYYYSTDNSRAGFSEQDPETIWQAFLGCINEISKKLKHVTVTVSLSSAMHSLLVMDDKNKPLTPLITWADTRSEAIAEELRGAAEGKRIFKATGTPIHSMSPLCKIIWLKKNSKRIFDRAHKFISIKEFIWFRLFKTYEIDYSIASATGLFNIHRLCWNTPSLLLCAIGPSQLSTLVPTNFTRKNIDASIAASLNIRPDTIFCIGASDGCLANLGSDAIKPGIAALTIGTSGAVRISRNKPVDNYGAMIFNYILDEKTFISGGPVNNGGNIVKWLFKTFLNNPNPSAKDYDNFFQLIETVQPACGGLLFLPYLYGERAPLWDEKASGVFAGIKSYHTNPHFLRAALEGICFSLKNILEIIEKSTAPVLQVNVSGGFVHSKIWMQMLADITGKKLCLQQTEDASSIGAAILYMRSAKLIAGNTPVTSHKEILVDPIKKNYLVYQEYYAIFRILYKNLKSPLHDLHKLNNS